MAAAGAEVAPGVRGAVAGLAAGAREALAVARGLRPPGGALVPSAPGPGEVLQVALLSLAILAVARSFQTLVQFLCGVLGMRSRVKRRKLAESLREQVWYSTSLFFWWRCLGHQPWLLDLSTCFSVDCVTGRTWTGGIGDRIPVEFQFIYFAELAWYIGGFISLLLDPKKKDFKQMAVHHVATIVLLGGSCFVGQHQIGAVVYFLHNISDPFLHWAKLLNYIGPALLGGDFLCNLAFLGYMLSFFVTRLVYYPYLMYTAEFAGPGWGRGGQPNTWAEAILIRFLVVLFPIHLYWFSLIVRVAYKSLTVGIPVKDERSDEEYDSDFDDGDTDKKKR